jgi:hypothetical protein
MSQVDPAKWEDLKAHFLQEAKEDEVGLWYIISYFRHDLNVEDPVERRRLTMQMVEELLASGHLQAGYYDPSATSPTGWRAWSLSPAEVLARIKAEWDRLGREPNIGDIVVFYAVD